MTQQSETALTIFADKYFQRHGFKNDREMYDSYSPWLYELAKKFVVTYEACDLQISALSDTGRMDAFNSKAKTLPAYIANYDVDNQIVNSYEVDSNLHLGIKQNCRYLVSAQTDNIPNAAIEKCFADRHDAKECLYHCINALSSKWIHIYYIKDNASLSYIGSYNAKKPADKQFWFSEEF